MVEFRDVSVDFGKVAAVRGVALSVPTGKTVALIGPSGCGKSTLIRACLGLVRLSSGVVTVGGQEVGPATLASVRRKTGYVVQDGGLFPHLTARQNVALMPTRLGLDATNRVKDLSELVRLPLDLLDRYPAELSGGQRQRVALMRALVLDPDLLLLDEPLSALDPMVRSGLQDDLKEVFVELGKTVVMVTHDMPEAAHFGDVIVLMNEGRVVQSGPLEDLLGSPADPFVRAFIEAQRRLVSL
ncbi:MAG: ATP-binding cassette domain-containing protein [Mycobacteriaceae bacterium]|nr:ATP-binding cassette domain-containing protein [Mycobacteriaceae bacterium]